MIRIEDRQMPSNNPHALAPADSSLCLILSHTSAVAHAGVRTQTVTSFDQNKVEAFLGVAAMPLGREGYLLFEVVGLDRILVITIDINEMCVSVEFFSRGGSQPIVDLRLPFCDSVGISSYGGNPVLEIVQTIDCNDCGSIKRARYVLRIKPEIRFWNDEGFVS